MRFVSAWAVTSLSGLHRVLRFSTNIPLAVDEQRAEGMVAVVPGLLRELDRPAEVPAVGVARLGQDDSRARGR